MTEITRWAVNLKHFCPSKEELVKAVSCVQSEEKERLLKFHFREDFNSSLVAQLLQRKFVNEFSDLPYSNIHFSRDEKNKPFLTNKLDTQIRFNVSHQGDYTVLAGFVSNIKCGIGVDLMKIDYCRDKPISSFFNLMKRNFSDLEWANINKHSKQKERLKKFMRHWCLKESYVKNIGVGITVDLQKISFEIIEDQLTTSNIVESTKLKICDVHLVDWKFEEHLLDEDHCAAIAISGIQNGISAPFRCMTLNELLERSKTVTDEDDKYCELILTKIKKH